MLNINNEWSLIITLKLLHNKCFLMSKRLDQSRQPARLRRRFSLIKTAKPKKPLSGYLRHSHTVSSRLSRWRDKIPQPALSPCAKSLWISSSYEKSLTSHRPPTLGSSSSKPVWPTWQAMGSYPDKSGCHSL